MAQGSVKGQAAGTSFHFLMESPAGQLLLTSDGVSVTAVRFHKSSGDPGELPLLTAAVSLPACLKTCRMQLDEYFTGHRQTFELPLHASGSAFRQRVWEALLRIPYGKTISYLELAVRMGDPALVRAVGSANASNPVAIIIPCHRVIGRDRSLVGYAGGIEKKKWLLDHERSNSGEMIQAGLF